MSKPKVATVWLEGCSGCHMSFLDLDEALLGVLEAVELTFSPVTDFKDYKFPAVTLGIIEGAIGNQEQVEIAHKLRAASTLIMAWGDCAVFGGINTMRNHIPLPELLQKGYAQTPTSLGAVLPIHPSLPALLPKALAVGDVVKVDIFVPGCPPSPQAIAKALGDVLAGRPPLPDPQIIHYD